MVTLTTGQLLTITTGTVFCYVGDIYKALNAITGDDLMTHLLPRASDFARGPLIEAHPWVLDIPEYEGGEDEQAVFAYIDRISEEHGETHEVPYLGDTWDNPNPLSSLVEMRKDAHE